MPTPYVVIVTGLPGSGKTTLGRRLAHDLQLPFLYKDGIKEVLFDTLGWSDREWSRRLGRATIELLYHIVEMELVAGRSVLVESNFDSDLASPRFRQLRDKYAFEVVQVHCRAARGVLLERFKARDGTAERHPGHVDASALAEMTERLTSGADLPVRIDGVLITVDTTDFSKVDHAHILQTVREAMC